MYLKTLRLWNFRKYGSGRNELDFEQPDLTVPFTSGLNLLIGENDSGKTAIIDAIKLVLRTHSNEWIRLEHSDFHMNTSNLRIEAEFYELTDVEASHFLEWLGWREERKPPENEGEEGQIIKKPYLKVFLEARRRDGKILPFDIRAGIDNVGNSLNPEARDYLRCTYLKPLRDAESELIPRRNSRLSQILSGHEAFKGRDEHHPLVGVFRDFNKQIEDYFKGKNQTGEDLEDQKGKELKDEIDRYLKQFINKESEFGANDGSLKEILERLELTFGGEKNLGLGSHNLLFISSELLHLNKPDWTGVRLGLVEEIEAHLHPQKQVRIIEALQKEEGIQLIFTTHSPNLASQVKLEHIFICQDCNVFPLGDDYTHLGQADYRFLERFLDTTKANLFFTNGIILVEGWAEELLLPALAKAIGINLAESEISVVNVGNTAFLRYARIFQRNAAPYMKINVAVVTDLDLRPVEYANESSYMTKLAKHLKDKEKKDAENYDEDELTSSFHRRHKIISEFNPGDEITKKKAEIEQEHQPVQVFVSTHWTLEYCLALSPNLRKLFFKAVLQSLYDEVQEEGIGEDTLAEYKALITNLDTHFNNWGDAASDIAYAIYQQILGNHSFFGTRKQKVSKALIAQHFANFLEEEADSWTPKLITDVKADPNIKYLIDAIEYAARDNG